MDDFFGRLAIAGLSVICCPVVTDESDCWGGLRGSDSLFPVSVSEVHLREVSSDTSLGRISAPTSKYQVHPSAPESSNPTHEIKQARLHRLGI